MVKHLYVERRMTPLDLWLRWADPLQQYQASGNSGLAIRDLAQANIFAGDLLIKNFGVTGRGRVVFYDYDEISLLTEVAFRRLPSPRDDAEEASAEPLVPRRARATCSPRSSVRFPVSTRATARAVPRDARRAARPGVVDGAPGGDSAPGKQPCGPPSPYPQEVRLGQLVRMRPPDPIPYPEDVRPGRILG